MSHNILTVDDAKAVRLLAAKALSNFDCEVDEASNGFNAFFAIERTRPDLILLDICMPVMEGYETLRRLKTAPELASIPVIMLASPADRPLLPDFTALGVAGILMKPFKESDLVAMIDTVITLKPRQSA